MRNWNKNSPGDSSPELGNSIIQIEAEEQEIERSAKPLTLAEVKNYNLTCRVKVILGNNGKEIAPICNFI